MKVFDWKNLDSWPLSWSSKYTNEDESWKDLYYKFLEEYSHIKVFHACRPDDPKSYYEKGLMVSNNKELRENVVNSVLKNLNVAIPANVIHAAAKKIGNLHDSRSFLGIDDRFLLQYSDDYLTYGSEYVHSIISVLESQTGMVSQNILKKSGTPTILEFDMPIHIADEDDVYHMVRYINNAIYEKYLNYEIDFTYEIWQTLPGKHLVRHYHPKRIKDPLNGNSMYKYEIYNGN